MEIYYWTDTPLIKSKTKTPTVLPIKDYQRHAIWDWYFIYRLGYAKVDKKYHASFGAGNCLTVFPRVLLPLKWVGVGRRRKWFRYFPWVLFMFSCICGYIRVLYLYVYVHTQSTELRASSYWLNRFRNPNTQTRGESYKDFSAYSMPFILLFYLKSALLVGWWDSLSNKNKAGKYIRDEWMLSFALLFPDEVF